MKAAQLSQLPASSLQLGPARLAKPAQRQSSSGLLAGRQLSSAASSSKQGAAFGSPLAYGRAPVGRRTRQPQCCAALHAPLHGRYMPLCTARIIKFPERRNEFAKLRAELEEVRKTVRGGCC